MTAPDNKLRAAQPEATGAQDDWEAIDTLLAARVALLVAVDALVQGRRGPSRSYTRLAQRLLTRGLALVEADQ